MVAVADGLSPAGMSSSPRAKDRCPIRSVPRCRPALTQPLSDIGRWERSLVSRNLAGRVLPGPLGPAGTGPEQVPARKQLLTKEEQPQVAENCSQLPATGRPLPLASRSPVLPPSGLAAGAAQSFLGTSCLSFLLETGRKPWGLQVRRR